MLLVEVGSWEKIGEEYFKKLYSLCQHVSQTHRTPRGLHGLLNVVSVFYALIKTRDL